MKHLFVASAISVTALCLAPAASAQTSNLGSNQQPQPCDCSNCSAEHCEPIGDGPNDPMASSSVTFDGNGATLEFSKPSEPKGRKRPAEGR